MEIIPGKRKDSYLYVYEGYTYNIDKRCNYIYRCAQRRITACKGLLIKENEKFIVDCRHNHPSEPYTVDILNLKKEMIQMCKETTITNKEIFDTVSRKNPKAAAFVSYHAMRNLLSREKIKMRPSLPSNVCDLDSLLQDYEPTKNIYKGYVTSEDNKYSYIFTSDKLLKILEKSSEIFIDGTFSVVPRAPSFAQLFSVHVRYMDKGIAVLFILCEARTQLVYKSIWKEIIKLAPDLECNLRFIMMDYEKASMNAVHEQFPHASLRGCWFHYCQAVLKKWKQLGLLKASRKIVSMAMTLALAPPEMFSEGLTLMQMIADEESENYPNMLLFMKYMRSTWLPISKKISVYGCPIRTNNLVESFHNIMTQKMQTVHPNLWIFLDNISKLITDQEINYNRLLNGLQVTRNRCRFNKYRNTRIQEAQNYLSTGIYSLQEFLQIFDENSGRQQYEMAPLIDDNDDDEICADLHTGGVVDAVPVNDVEITHQNIRRRRRTRRCKYNFNELEAADIENKSQSTGFLSCSENITDKNQNKLEVITAANVEWINENSHFLGENTNMYDSVTDICDGDLNKLTGDNENCSQSQKQGTFNTAETIEVDENKDIEENSDNNEEHIYEVPYDDYDYWINNESTEEDKQETPFFSIKNIQSSINTNSLYEEGRCVICLVEKSKIVFIPCGHLCCCKNCIQKLLQERCPVCNNIYDKYMSIITP